MEIVKLRQNDSKSLIQKCSNQNLWSNISTEVSDEKERYVNFERQEKLIVKKMKSTLAHWASKPKINTGLNDDKWRRK